MPKSKAFTLLECLITFSLIALLMAISGPAFFSARKHTAKAKCIARGQELYRGAQKLFDDLDNETAKSTEPLSTDIKWWQNRLRAYGVSDEAWHYPIGNKPKGSAPDFFYGGVSPKDFNYAEDRDQLYLFIGKSSFYSEGNLVVMADGTVKFENFFPE